DFLLSRAVELGRLFLTQDRDFPRIATEWQRSGRDFPGVLFAPQGTSIGRLVADLELIANCAAAAELAGRVQFLPLP
ncbi:MAG TPA: hypothetical protein VF170_03725, partial [Planctomycetaceae bacterium]